MLMRLYIREFEVPEEVGKGEKREIVISPLEASKTGNSHDHQEQFSNVNQHNDYYYNQTSSSIIIILIKMELPPSSKPSKKIPKMTMQEIHDNEETLKRINRKIDFQKNPRYQNIASHKYTDVIHSHTMSLAKQNKGAFRCEPPEIVFSNFQKDIIYEFQVVLVNTSKLLRRIKVTPIASEEFVVSNVIYPNENSGDIASGMKAKIVIRFLPKEIKTYESELIVFSEDSVLKIPIYTLRDEPELKFNKEIDCGSCWTGSRLLVSEKIVNTGGDAEFKLVSGNGRVTENTLRFENFEVEPCQFKLKRNEQIQIKVSYSADTKGRSTETINITSQYLSQATKLSFNVSGNSFDPQLQLLSLNNSQCNSAIQSHKLYFPNVSPNVPSTYTLTIKNLANLSLPYFWQIDNHQDFQISEKNGTLTPYQVKQFVLTYNSPSFIPNFAKAGIFIGHDNGDQTFPLYQFLISANPQKYAVKIQPQYYEFPELLVFGTWYQKRVQLFNVPEGTNITISKLESSDNTETEYSISDTFTGTKQILFRFMIPRHDNHHHQTIYKVQVENSSICYFEIKGKSKLPAIKLAEAVDFGLIKTNSEAHSSIKLSNPNQIPLSVRIVNDYQYYLPEHSYLYDYDDEDFQSVPKRFWIEKQELVIEPMSQVELACSYQSKQDAQSITAPIQVIVENGVGTSFELRVEVQEVHVILSNSYYNLKQLFVNNTYTLRQLIRKQTKLQLLNLGNIDTEFKWENTESQDCRFQFQPSSGIIPAKSKIEMAVKIIPLRNGKISQKVSCVVQGKQKMIVCFDADIRGLEIRYALVNQQLAKRILVKESLDLSKTDRTRTNRLASLTSSVSYLKEKQKEKVIYPQLTGIGFFNCEINIPKQMEIMLQNHSDLDTQFDLRVLKYPGTNRQSQSQLKSDFPGKITPFSSEMGATFIAKRQLEKSQKQYLKEAGNGVTIICEPPRGELKRGGEVKIKITLFNNICGRFQDSLEVNITNYDTKVFPIDIDIKGTPIGVSKNQLGISFNSIFPVYNFGCFPTNSGTIRKEFKVVNKGPRPVDLVWKIYSLDKPRTGDPFKISICPPSLGSKDPVSVNWEAIEPECQQNSLFAIHPHSKTIQSQQQTSFTVSYQTLQTPQSSKCILIGQPYLLNEQGEKMKMELMPIIPQASTVKPHLKLDKYVSNLADDNLIILQKYAGEESEKDTKSIILENTTGSNLICSFQTLDPSKFKIISSSTNSGSNNLLSKTQNQFTKSLTNNLGTNKAVQSCFNIATGSYVELKLKFESDLKNPDDWPAAPKFRKEGKLLISYSNQDTQEIPLLGQLYRPILQLNTSGKQGSEADEIIDFGVVHTKNDKKKTIYISNISPVKGKWSLKYVKLPAKRKFEQVLWTKLDQEDMSITDDKDCFNFSLNEGTVQSMTIPIKSMPHTLALPAPDDEYAKTHVAQKLMIAFKPKKDVLYKSRFKILVENGEPLEFVLRGMGTYEEEYLK